MTRRQRDSLGRNPTTSKVLFLALPDRRRLDGGGARGASCLEQADAARVIWTCSSPACRGITGIDYPGSTRPAAAARPNHQLAINRRSPSGIGKTAALAGPSLATKQGIDYRHHRPRRRPDAGDHGRGWRRRFPAVQRCSTDRSIMEIVRWPGPGTQPRLDAQGLRPQALQGQSDGFYFLTPRWDPTG